MHKLIFRHLITKIIIRTQIIEIDSKVLKFSKEYNQLSINNMVKIRQERLWTFWKKN